MVGENQQWNGMGVHPGVLHRKLMLVGCSALPPLKGSLRGLFIYYSQLGWYRGLNPSLLGWVYFFCITKEEIII